MQITSLWEAVARRWLALLVVFVLGVAAGLFSWMTTEQKYNAEAVAIVLPPAVPGQPLDGNPLSRVSFDSTEMSTLAATLMMSPAVADEITQKAGGALVSVDNLLSTTSPNPQRTMRVTLVAEGDTPEQAVASAAAAIAATRSRFATFQTQLKVGAAYRSDLVQMIAPHPSRSDRSSKLRAAGGSALGVIGLGVVAVLAFDILMAMRERRRLGLDLPRHQNPDPGA